LWNSKQTKNKLSILTTLHHKQLDNYTSTTNTRVRLTTRRKKDEYCHGWALIQLKKKT
jgi:hypothetical protein